MQSDEASPDGSRIVSGETQGAANAEEPLWDVPELVPVAGTEATAPWQFFARGCRLIRIGLYVELLALVILFTAVIAAASQPIWDHVPPGIANGYLTKYWPFVFAPFFCVMAIGAGYVAVGRFFVARVPPGTGSRSLFVTNTLLAAIRCLALVVAVATLLLGVMFWEDVNRKGSQPSYPHGPQNPGTKYTDFAVRAYGIAVFAGTIAELGMIPGFLLVAGAIRSTQLRMASGTYAFTVQLISLLYTAALVALYLLDLFGASTPPAEPIRKPGQQSDFVVVALTASAFFFATFVMYAVVTFLIARMYGLARSECTHEDRNLTLSVSRSKP